MILGNDTNEVLREARRRAGVTQDVLAERAGVRRQTITGVESGRRVPSLPMLVSLLAAAGVQARVELEPLDADLERLLADEDAAARASRRVAQAVESVVGLTAQQYRIEGAAAVALLGAPVPVPELDVALADTPETLEWLTQRWELLSQVRLYRDSPRIDPWQSMLSVPPYRVGLTYPDDGSAPEQWPDPCTETRETLLELTRGRPFWIWTYLGSARARLAPPDVVAHTVVVDTEHGPVRVQPLDSLVTDGTALDRFIRVLRAVRAG
ncbi:helix-turn-helix domain-containing protein [Xylanimonas sp. McL0601]|uniref:helix-turn-helix domain-containing protein n=1 Tax=Xylanimonas sp. McL0601 TaxID=3414739 RepID=UPI003CED9769